MIVVRVASSSLPRAVFLLGTALFVLCVAGTLLSLGVFFWYDTDFWDYFSVRPVLQVAAALLSGFVDSPGQLFWHYRRQESYITFRGNVFPELLVPFAAQSPVDRSGTVLFFENQRTDPAHTRDRDLIHRSAKKDALHG
jgi:hypothetical protein